MTEPRGFDPLVDVKPSRYIVGIDLGTTNCAVCYTDTSKRPWKVRVLKIPQLVAPGEVESRETLPSFHYEPVRDDSTAAALSLPWTTERGPAGKRASKKDQDSPQRNGSNRHGPLAYAVGFMARDEGVLAPGRLIASTKSWLCHTGIDRTAEVLPWHGAADVERLSPVEVSSRFLEHIRDAWDQNHRANPLADQDIVVTLPASFDEVARELTIDAAARAGLRRVVLIEEPQAAFYAWLYKHADSWDQLVSPGQNILVCDIGGGTTDFTLIRAQRNEAKSGDGENVQFHRVAVGDHLILGGDNLDLALAHLIERKLMNSGKLPKRQWGVLVRSCRNIKETLLGDDAPASFTVSLPGGGSKVIGGSLQARIDRDEVRDLLMNGFLPEVSLDEMPQQRQSGFQEFGLPYAPDAAITRYLAAFLCRHGNLAQEESVAHAVKGRKAKNGSRGAKPRRKQEEAEAARPDVILWNGGFFASSLLRQRLLDVVTSWFPARRGSSWAPTVLDNDRLDLAVARGAAYYGMVRRGQGVRITANLARSYYIRVQSEPPSAVCLAPGNAETGQDIELADRTFELLVSKPVEFPLYVSSTRLTDRPGQVVEVNDEQMTPLPPIRTVLKTRRRGGDEVIPVVLHSRLTETGTFDLWCSEVDSDRSWRLQFDVRSTTQTDLEAHDASGESAGVVDEETWRRCYNLIRKVYSPDTADDPTGLMKQLSKTLGQNRSKWPPSLLRRMWDTLMELEEGRRISESHEARWLNLLGYSLRPGYGVAVDDWRVSETWRTVRNKLVHHATSIRNESLILWRRVSGGLSTGQQMAIAEPLLSAVRATYGTPSPGKRHLATNFRPNESIEVWRSLGSLELLGVALKIELGDLLVDLLGRRKLAVAHAAMAWALGRLGQRTTLYGPLNTVVPSEACETWLQRLIELDRDDPIYRLAVMQLARRTDDRYRDLSEPLREQAIRWLTDQRSASHLVQLVREGGRLDREEQGQVFGESLPAGLRLREAG